MKTIPAGICQCGCGAPTRIAPVNDKSKGWVKGTPLKYLKGHGFKNGKKGSASPLWRGGRQKSSQGYVVLWTPEGRKYEHIVVAERALGRPLRQFGKGHPKNKVVHHVNGDKTDNRPENLLICTNEYHIELHSLLETSAAWPEFSPRLKHPCGRKFHGASGFKGVHQGKAGKWEVRIKVDGKMRFIGRFESPRDAALAYDDEAVRIHGEHWSTNRSMGLL